jgi:hypothetical protein
MSGVEDDPRSRYSDFSCVTPLEQLINEIEQILIKTWRVRDHAGWKSGRSENVELRCPMLAEGAIRLELFALPEIDASVSTVESADKAAPDHWQLGPAEEEDALAARWGANRSGSTGQHLCEWFGARRGLAVFVPRCSSLLRGWSSTSKPSPQDRARVLLCCPSI